MFTEPFTLIVQTVGVLSEMGIHGHTSWWHDVIEWKHFPALLAFCVGNSPNKGKGRGALMFSLICAWINGWVNNREAGDLWRHRVHYDVTVMKYCRPWSFTTFFDHLCERASVCHSLFSKKYGLGQVGFITSAVTFTPLVAVFSKTCR